MHVADAASRRHLCLVAFEANINVTDLQVCLRSGEAFFLHRQTFVIFRVIFDAKDRLNFSRAGGAHRHCMYDEVSGGTRRRKGKEGKHAS